MMTGIILLIIISIIIVTMIINRIRRIQRYGFELFLIRKGNHYSGILPSMWRFVFAKKTLRWSTIFAEGCDYRDRSGGDINKLYGISYGLDPHYRSVRVGWRWNDNLRTIELFAYYYIKGKRKYSKLCDVVQYSVYNFVMFHDGTHIIIQVSEATDYGEAQLSCHKIPFDKQDTWLRIQMFPYFGGNYPAPNDIKILIKHES